MSTQSYVDSLSSMNTSELVKKAFVLGLSLSLFTDGNGEVDRPELINRLVILGKVSQEKPEDRWSAIETFMCDNAEQITHLLMFRDPFDKNVFQLVVAAGSLSRNIHPAVLGLAEDTIELVKKEIDWLNSFPKS